jgi:hypothetical protein
MTSERPNCFLAHGGIFREPRNERVPEIVPSSLDACSLQGAPPSAFPLPDRPAEVNVSDARTLPVSAESNCAVREEKRVRSPLAKKLQPVSDRFSRAICQRHDTPRSGFGFGFGTTISASTISALLHRALMLPRFNARTSEARKPLSTETTNSGSRTGEMLLRIAVSKTRFFLAAQRAAGLPLTLHRSYLVRGGRPEAEMLEDASQSVDFEIY